jgi:single-strand DNA-binding protein
LVEGNLVRDPQLKFTAKGTPICVFSMASDRFYGNDTGLEKEVSFFEVETWGKLATLCGETGEKGRGVRVVGRLKQDRWVDTEGKNRSKVIIIGEHVEFRTLSKQPPVVETEPQLIPGEVSPETEEPAEETLAA